MFHTRTLDIMFHIMSRAYPYLVYIPLKHDTKSYIVFLKHETVSPKTYDLQYDTRC